MNEVLRRIIPTVILCELIAFFIYQPKAVISYSLNSIYIKGSGHLNAIQYTKTLNISNVTSLNFKRILAVPR